MSVYGDCSVCGRALTRIEGRDRSHDCVKADLLEAAKTAEEYLSIIFDGYPESTMSRAAKPYRAKIQAAIAKAESRS